MPERELGCQKNFCICHQEGKDHSTIKGFIDGKDYSNCNEAADPSIGH